MEVVNVLPAGSNGTIELLYMQVETASLTLLRHLSSDAAIS